MENKVKYEIREELAKYYYRKDEVSYEYSVLSEMVEEFDNLEDAKAKFESDYKYTKILREKNHLEYDVEVYSLVKVMEKDENNFEVEDLEISDFEYKNDELYKLIIKDVNTFETVLSEYTNLKFWEKDLYLHVIKKIEKENLSDFMYEVLENLENEFSFRDEEDEVKERLNEIIEDIKENGEITIY